MKKSLLVLVGLGLSFNLFAAEFDLEAIMKEMKLAYRQASKADTVEEMQKAVDRLDELVAKAKQGDYSPERDVVYQEGYQKLTVAFAEIDGLLAKGELEQAQDELDNIDALKKEYHKKAKKIK
jgi:soluble cytochrome b562